MQLPQPLFSGRLVRRYQRFLADIELDDGRLVTAHTPNTGSMRQCAVAGQKVLVSKSNKPNRKLAWSWELVEVNSHWVDINTHRANRVVEEGLNCGLIPEFRNYTLKAEVPFADSRIDFRLDRGAEKVLLEVKNVTLCCEPGQACFPDAVTTRGQKHLCDLMAAVQAGWRAVIFFLVQRGEAERFTAADQIDAAYGRLLRRARDQGVEVLAYRTRVSPTETVVADRLTVEF